MTARLDDMERRWEERIRDAGSARSMISSVRPGTVDQCRQHQPQDERNFVAEHIKVKWFKGFPMPDDQ